MGRRAAGGPTRGRNRAARFALLAAAVTVTIGVFTAAGGASAGGAPTPGVRPSTPVPVACPGTTTVGVFTVTCGGSGASIASVVENPHGEPARGQAQELAFTPKPSGSGSGTGTTGTPGAPAGTTIIGIDVGESQRTTATGVVTFAVPGPTGVADLAVDVSVTRSDGGSISSVAGSQPGPTVAYMAVKHEGGGDTCPPRCPHK